MCGLVFTKMNTLSAFKTACKVKSYASQSNW